MSHTGNAQLRPEAILHFTPAASFARKFLFHPTLHDAAGEVHFFAIGKSGFRFDQSTLFEIFREYLCAIKLLWKGVGQKNRLSVAYCHTTLYALPALLLCRLFGVGRVVYFNHGVPYIGHHHWIRFALKVIDRLNVVAAHSFVTISPAMVPFLRSDAEVSKHCTTPGSSSGLPKCGFVTQLLVRSQMATQSKPVRFLYAGRLKERKGVFVLLDAWRLHVQSFPEDELWLCGFSRGEYANFSAWNDLPNVIVHGYVHDMRSIYDQVDVVISPSFHEGFGYTLLEGAARGCCIVSSDVPGPDVIFTKWMNWQLFAVGDALSLAMVMARLSESSGVLAVGKRLSYRSALRFQMHKIKYPASAMPWYISSSHIK